MKYRKFEELSKSARERAFSIYESTKADKAFEDEIKLAVEGIQAFMDSIHEYSDLPDFGGVYLRCKFWREDFEDIDFDAKPDTNSANVYEWELANLYAGMMHENRALFGIVQKIDEWYWDWMADNEWYDSYEFSDLHTDLTKKVEDKYKEILDACGSLMEGLADGMEGEYFCADGYFENIEAPNRRYHEDGTPWTVRQAKA